MLTTRLPRYLPFAQYHRVGLPYHGLVRGIDANKDGTLTLPDSTTMKYRQALNGDTVMVRGPAAAVTEEEVVGAYRWRNYALLSGNTRRIGDQDLGEFGWLYCDDHATWHVTVDPVQNSDGSLTVTVYLEDLFGYLAHGPKTVTRRSIGSLTFTPTKPNGDPAPANPDYPDVYNDTHLMTHSATGAKTILNIGGRNYWPATRCEIWLTTQITAAQAAALWAGSVNPVSGVHTALQILISGNGALTGNDIGDGISATVSVLRSGDQMVTEYTSTYNNAPGYEIRYAATFMDVVLADGSTTAVSFEQHTVDTYVEYPPPTIGEVFSYEERSDTVSLSVGSFSQTIAQTRTETSIYNGFNYDYVRTDEEDSVAVAAVSRPVISFIAWRDSLDCYPIPYFVFPVGKYYGSMFYYCRVLAAAGDDTNRKSKLISLSTFSTEDVNKPAGVEWLPGWIAGNNCSHDPVADTFSYDLTVTPFYCPPSGVPVLTDATNNTAISYV